MNSTNCTLQRELINGETGGCLSTLDRGLLFGDGVFETIAVQADRPRFWTRHMARLQAGCQRLGIPAVDESRLLAESGQLLGDAASGQNHVLKIIVTRGPGSRGYRPDPSAVPTRILQLHAWPDIPPGDEGIRATVCTLRLGNNPQLAGIKHLNRLEQVLARAEWNDDGIREGLLLDQAGRVIEGTMSNLFLVKDGKLLTPDLTRCGVAGIRRDIVLELARQTGLSTQVCDISHDRLLQADELFVCNSLIGIWPVIALNGNRFPKGPVTTGLQSALQAHDDDNHTWRV